MDRPWMKKPGELHDIKGVPIHPGDLLRSNHFVELTRRGGRRQHYLYHTAVFKDDAMYMVPTSHLQPTKINQGGSCLMMEEYMVDSRVVVIHGYGPGECLDFRDRKKVKRSVSDGLQ